jgi:hypothetical protein
VFAAIRGNDAPPRVAPAPLAARPGRLDVGGVIDSDTVWDAEEITVTGDVTVSGGASLAIAAGATVRFAGFWGLRIGDGDLQAIGAPGQPITFTSSEPDLWQPDLARDGAWNGIALVNVPAARDSSRLRWCVLEHAKALPGEDWIEPDGAGGVLVDGVGGALRVVGRSPLVMSHSVLRHNLAERGGAIGIHHGARPLLVNNLLHDNHATLRASAIWISYADAVLVQNTLVANKVAAPSSAIETGCIDHVYARPWHVGNIVWGNQTDYYTPLQIREPKVINTRFCDIEAWLGGEGCLSVDPQLADFVPAAGSPVLDAASALAAGGWLPDRDLAGGARVAGAEVDMGAFERVDPTPAPRLADAAVSLRVWPNPGNPRLMLAVTVPQAGAVKLTIHDLRGRRLRTLLAAERPAGRHEVSWDGRDGRGRALPAGVYLGRAVTAAGVATSRLTLVR